MEEEEQEEQQVLNVFAKKYEGEISRFKTRRPDVPDHVDQAIIGVEKHLDFIQITEIFNRLLTSLVHKMPESGNIQNFLLGELKQMKHYRENPQQKEPKYFTIEEMETLYEMYDPAELGYVNLTLLKQAMLAIGVPDPDAAIAANHPELKENSKINK